MGGYRDILELSGVWLPRPPAPPMRAGYRDILELSGVWLPGQTFVPPEGPEQNFVGFLNTNVGRLKTIG